MKMSWLGGRLALRGLSLGERFFLYSIFLFLLSSVINLHELGRLNLIVRSLDFFVRDLFAVSVIVCAVIYVRFFFCSLHFFWGLLVLYILGRVIFFGDIGFSGDSYSWFTFFFSPNFSVFSWLLFVWIFISAGKPLLESYVFRFIEYLTSWPLLIISAVFYISTPNFPTLALSVICVIYFYALNVFRGGSLVDAGFYKLIFLAVAAAIGGERVFVVIPLISVLLVTLSRRTVWPLIFSIVFGFLCLAFSSVFFEYYFEDFSFFVFDFLGIEDNSGVSINTRGFIFDEFFQDLSGYDLVFGRGVLGAYFSPYFLDFGLDGGDYFYRQSVEVGWLNFVLKFGFVGLVLFLLGVVFTLYGSLKLLVVNSEVRAIFVVLSIYLVVFSVWFYQGVFGYWFLWIVFMARLVTIKNFRA